MLKSAVYVLNPAEIQDNGFRNILTNHMKIFHIFCGTDKGTITMKGQVL